MTMSGPKPAGDVDSTTADTAQAAVTPPATHSPSTRPSLWSSVWALLAFLYLAFARRTFGKLGR